LSFLTRELLVLASLVAHAALWVVLSLEYPPDPARDEHKFVLIGFLVGLIGVLSYSPVRANGRTIMGRKPESLRPLTQYECWAYFIVPFPISWLGWLLLAKFSLDGTVFFITVYTSFATLIASRMLLRRRRDRYL